MTSLADLIGDGRLNTIDMELYMQGVEPRISLNQVKRSPGSR